MSGLQQIGVRVEVAGDTSEPTVGSVQALGNEIAGMLARLIETGQSGALDLRSLPLGIGDRDALAAMLGLGAVRATVDALGPTELRETSVAGVWWVQHRNVHGDIVAELVEIATVPEILKTPRDDLRDGLMALRERIGVGHAGAGSL